MDCFQERSFYYFRHGLFGHAVKICEIGLEKKQTSLILYVYCGIARGMLGHTEEAIKILSHLKMRQDLSLVYDSALYCIYLSSKTNSQEKISHFYNNIKNNIDNANPLSSFISAQIFIFFQLYDLARQIFSSANSRIEAEKKLNPNHSTSFNSGLKTMEVWLDMMDGHPKRAIKKFDDIMTQSGNKYDILCLYGKAVCHTILGQYLDSIQIYNVLLAKYDFPELNIEKSRIYILMKKWDLASNLSEEIRNKLFSLLELKSIIAFQSLLSSQKDQVTTDLLDDLFDDIQKLESTNWRYQIKLSFSLSTLSNHSFSIFDRIIKLSTHAYENSNNDDVCCSILGYHQYLAHNYVASLNSIQKVLEKDSCNRFAMETNIRLMIDTGRFLEAQDAIDFYCEVDLDHDFIVETLKSKLCRKMIASNEINFLPLVDSLNGHLKRFMSRPAITSNLFKLESKYESFFDMYIHLRSDAIIESLDELIVYNYSFIYNLNGKYGTQLLNILKPLTTLFTYHSPFNFFYALLLKRNNRLDDSFSYFERILCSTEIFRLPQCLTEISELLVFRQMEDVAVNCIEEASIEDPSLVSSLEFVMTKAKIVGNIKESIPAIVHLIESMQTKAIPKNTEASESNNSIYSKCPFYLYLKFIDLCISVDAFEVAGRTITRIMNSVTHSCEKAMLMMRYSIILASKGKMDKAISNLNKLKNHNRFLIEATETEAEIHLKFEGNIEKYIACFHSLSLQEASSERYCLLGRAHHKLKQFDLAIDAYQKAIELDKHDETALTQLAIAYISAHRFEDAVSLFTRNISVMRNTTQKSLAFLRLMIQLKKYDDADQCIINIMRVSNEMSPTTISAYLELQGDIQMSKKNYTEAIKIYNQSLNNIEKIIESDVNNAFSQEIKHIASMILYKIAKSYEENGETEKSIDFFNRSLFYNDRNAITVCSLFELFKKRYDIEKCKKVCADYLSNDPQNESIALLFTSIEVNSFSESISCIRNVLDVHPFFIKSLVRLVEICARSGKLHLAYHYITLAKSSSPSFFFSVGLYYQYVGNNTKSLFYFKKACESNKWRIPAKISIISLLSNPDRKYIWCEEGPLASEENINECENILNSLTENGRDLDESTRLLIKADIYCSRNTTESVNEAKNIYSDLYSKNAGDKACRVGLARCLTRFGETEQAERLLNFVLTEKPFLENCSYFEEAYLMLAHIVETKKNFTSAQHFIFFALELNMGCKKAWEMSAAVNRKNKMYNEAANAFGHLWELCDHSDPEIGYEYAYCSMKSHKFETALIVCRDVLKLHPEYKDLKQEILIPSFQKIRK